MPEEHFAEAEEGQDAEEGKGDHPVPDGGDLDGRMCPQGQARKIQDHGKDGNLRAGAGGHEDLNEPDEDHGGTHHLHGHFHLQGFVRFPVHVDILTWRSHVDPGHLPSGRFGLLGNLGRVRRFCLGFHALPLEMFTERESLLMIAGPDGRPHTGVPAGPTCARTRP